MNDAVAVLDSALEARRNELAQIEADEADEIAATLEDVRPGTTVQEQTGGTVGQSYDGGTFADDMDEFLEDDAPVVRKYRLAAQIAALEEVKKLLTSQHSEVQASFLAMKRNDERSSRQNLWLTLTTSGISIVIGWLLSLLSSPEALVHAFGR